MKVSIIIPVYNRAETVKRTLETVLRQKYRPLELILVDNASTDDTLVVLNQFKIDHGGDDIEIKVLQEPVKGACAARNKGFENATGDWVMFFDSDDEMAPNLVRNYVDEIGRNSGALDLVLAKGTLVNPDGEKQKLPFFTSDLFANHILHSVIATQRFAVRRDFFAKTDGWNLNLPAWNDWEMGFRLLLARPRVAFLKGKPQVVVNHSGADSITGTGFSSRHGYWEKVITLLQDQVRCSDLKEKQRYMRLLEYRRVVLAAQYFLEGNYGFAQGLYSETYSRNKKSWRMRLLLPRLYKRICKWKRGSARIARVLIK
ncbi:MAG: glycosyltransferase [Muribaculaceae bacterium]|nr:glycosyltransferase [Muribaculaceae bacterium]